MRTRKDIEREAKNITEAHKKLQADLVQLEEQEKALLEQIGESIVAGERSEAADKLVELRGRKESLQQAFSLARQKEQEVAEELTALGRAEIAGQWPGLEKDMRSRLAKLRALLGKNGAKGELDNLQQILVGAQQAASYASQDAQIWSGKVQGACNVGAKALWEFWVLLEQLDNPGFSPNALDANGEIPGFGKLS